MVTAKIISESVHRHPTVKMLARSFLLLIGGSLIAEGFDHHISVREDDGAPAERALGRDGTRCFQVHERSSRWIPGQGDIGMAR